MALNMDENNVNVILDSTALEKVKHTKFLGVLIEDCLTWKNHIDCVSKTISRYLRLQIFKLKSLEVVNYNSGWCQVHGCSKSKGK